MGPNLAANSPKAPVPLPRWNGTERSPGEAVLNDREFRHLSTLIHEQCGIKLSTNKATMLETRLRKRLRALGLSTFTSYCDFLFTPPGLAEELPALIDAVTTNKTDFFREPAHFDFLLRTAVPAFLSREFSGSARPLRVWSAGCSTGEEPYTLAMLLREYCSGRQGLDFSILATDICTAVLEKARNAVYEADRIEAVPAVLRRRFFLKSKDVTRGLVRIVPELRRLVRFQRLNFMDSQFPITEPMDIIFCRNVLIYFDRPTQECLLRKLTSHLFPGGFLFIGHSESLNGLDVPVVQVTSTIYRKPS